MRKTNDNAQLTLIACVQNRDVIAKALTGRNDLGSFDRLTPEYSVEVRARKLPKIDKAEAGKLMVELTQLLEKAASGLTTSKEAYAELEAFWDRQPEDIQERARFRRDVWLDALYEPPRRGPVGLHG